MAQDQTLEKTKMQDGTQALRFTVGLSLDEVCNQPALPKIVRQSLGGSVSWQQRNEASLARFLAGPNQFPAFVLALLACGAVVEDENGQQADLNDWLLSRDRMPAEALLVPVEDAGRKLAAARVGLTPAGQGIVEAAAGLVVEDGVVRSLRLALNGVWPGRQWLSAQASLVEGKSLSSETIQAVAQAVQDEVDPPADHLGSAEYRCAMAAVLVRQVLEACR